MEKENNIKQQTISGLFWKFGERILAQFVSFVVSIVLARILMPDEYGIVALCMVFINICNVFVSCGLGTSLVQKLNADELDFSSVLYASIFLSVIFYIIMFFVAPFIANFYGNYDKETLTKIIRLMSLRLPIAAINSVQHAYVSRKMIFKKFFWSTLFGTVVSGVVGIILAINGFGVYALVVQYLTNVIIDTLILAITIKWKPILKFSLSRIKVLFSYGWKLLVSGLLDTGYNELRSLIIGKKYLSSDLAYYEKGKQFPSLIVTNINSSIDGVLFPTISKVQNNSTDVKRITKRAIKTSSYIMYPLMMGLAVVAKPLVTILLTEKWLFCVPYLRIMCFIYAFMPIHTANLQAIKAMGRSDLFLILEIIKKVIGITVLLITMWYGVYWIAFGGIITTIISSIINSFPNKKLLHYGYGEQLKDLSAGFFLSVVMGAIVYSLQFIGLGVYGTLIIQVIVGATIYILLSKIFKIESFEYLLNALKEFKHRRQSIHTVKEDKND